MIFQLEQDCTAVTDAPLRIYALQVQRIVNGKTAAQIGLAFQYNPAKKNFDIYAETIQPGKALSHTKITTCKTGESVNFVLTAESKKKSLTCTLTKKDGTLRTFDALQSYPASTVKLVPVSAEVHPASGAKAQVQKYVPTPGPITRPKAPNDKAPIETAQKAAVAAPAAEAVKQAVAPAAPAPAFGPKGRKRKV